MNKSMFKLFKNSIRNAVIFKLEQKIKDAQRDYEAQAQHLEDMANVEIKNIKERCEEEKQNYFQDLVNSILK